MWDNSKTFKIFPPSDHFLRYKSYPQVWKPYTRKFTYIIFTVIWPIYYSCQSFHLFWKFSNPNHGHYTISSKFQKGGVPRSSRRGAAANESDQEPRGRGPDPCPRSAGQGSGVAMSCGTGRRHLSDPASLRLRHRPAATAPTRPPAEELLHASSRQCECSPKKAKQQQQKPKQKSKF